MASAGRRPSTRSRTALEGPCGKLTIDQRAKLLNRVADEIEANFDAFLAAEVAVALEGLQEALRQRMATPTNIARHAQRGGIATIVRPYLEAPTANAEARKVIENLCASIRARLTTISRSSGQPFDILLTHIGIERLLYLLAISRHADHSVLKGAMPLITPPLTSPANCAMSFPFPGGSPREQ